MNLKRWHKLNLVEQLANIGSEITRISTIERMKDTKNQMKAFWRALELIDLTLNDKRWKSRLKEIVRLREVLCDSVLLKKKFYNVSLKDLEKYCLYFALKARGFLK